jgi:hypothetical protein
LFARVLGRTLVIILGSLLVVEVVIGALVIGSHGDIGVDFRFYRDLAARWMADGTYFQPYQLEGPYVSTSLVDTFYPPIALLLFVPFLVLPAFLWWLTPIVVLAYVIASWRPNFWAIALMIALMMWVRAFGAFLWGNTDMWLVAAVAAGLRWGWPAALIAIKPSVLPFILVGTRSRFFWIATAAVVLVSIPMWELWRDWVIAIRNMDLRLDYSLGSVTLYLVPVVAWFGRRRAIGEPILTVRPSLPNLRSQALRRPARPLRSPASPARPRSGSG